MVNYKTITDTGPITFSPYMLRQQQGWLHGPTALPQATDKPTGSPPQSNPETEQSPPSFFEPGNRIRWLILLLPFIFNKYHYGQFSPHGLSLTNFLHFYFVFFLCCVIVIHLALNVKRRTLCDLLNSPNGLQRFPGLQTAYNKPTNTILIPAICIGIGLIKMACTPRHLHYHLPYYIAFIIFFSLIFLVIFYTNNYRHTYDALYGVAPTSHAYHMHADTRNAFLRLGTLGITWVFIYERMVALGFFDDND